MKTRLTVRPTARLAAPLAALLCMPACGTDRENDSAGVSASGIGGGATSGGDGSDDGDGGDGGGGGEKLDVEGGGSGMASAEAGEERCEKIDFLFIIDNSGSMEDEQQSLIASFEGFIQTAEEATGARDFQIMVIDTDTTFAEGGGSSITCTPDCCDTWCPANPGGICNNMLCDAPMGPTGCDAELGAGKTKDEAGNECGIDSGHRYMLDTQADLAGTFSCVGLVGINGDGNERPMEAMAAALGPQSAPGGCNDGFVRDDAVLVVTLITDEEDDDENITGAACGGIGAPGSTGNPEAWFQSVVAAKGVESNAVVLNLVGPPPPAGADDPQTCPALDKCGNAIDGAEAAPRLVEFGKRFTHHVTGRVCEPTYDAFFAEAVAKISTACDEFVPQG